MVAGDSRSNHGTAAASDTKSAQELGRRLHSMACGEVGYQVNSLAYISEKRWLLTSGSDGLICLTDLDLHGNTLSGRTQYENSKPEYTINVSDAHTAACGPLKREVSR